MSKIIISILISIISTTLIIQSIEAQISPNCNRSCGFHSINDLPPPFGFSSACQIPLNCSIDAKISIHEFQIDYFTPNNILVNLPANCSRKIDSIKRLYSLNYAPTSHNGILLQNCISPVTTCFIPTTAIQTRFENTDCRSNLNSSNTISCYSEQDKSNSFLDYSNLTSSGCELFFSSISSESLGSNTTVSLGIERVQLEWWLNGDCKNCSKHATCIQLVSPIDGSDGYRCQCLTGFNGDGYGGGSGCRKESRSCNPSRFLSGRCGGTTRVGVLIGGISVGASLIIGVALVICFIRKRTISTAERKTKRQLSEVIGNDITIYPYSEMEKATNKFAVKRRLGTGAYGTVYSGKLHDDKWVAIKRIKHRVDSDNGDQVMNEIKLISSVNHPNLVRLLGCSIEKGEQILVYEFMPNGTLSQHLQKERGNGLAWPIRITIACEIAQAIAYLHSTLNPPIYHRDIKSSNILLDYNYKTKIADFGLSRLGKPEGSHVSTTPQGTPGYLDPQYHQNFHLSDKSDVYSFGVVLAEIITGLKAVDFTRPPNEVILASLVLDRIGKGCVDAIIDPFFGRNMDKWTVSSLHKVAELTFRCLAFQSDARPSMVEVASELEQIQLSKWALSTSDCLNNVDDCNKQLPDLIVEESGQQFRNLNCMESLNNDSSHCSIDTLWPSDASPSSSNSFAKSSQNSILYK